MTNSIVSAALRAAGGQIPEGRLTTVEQGPQFIGDATRVRRKGSPPTIACEVRSPEKHRGPSSALRRSSSAPRRAPSLVTAVSTALMLVALCACGYAGDDEIQAETTAILGRVPIGTPFMEVPAAMGALGFSCAAERREVTDAQGGVRGTESHFSCTREQSHWLVCTQRTRVVLLQLNGKLSNILVNVGRFCF